MSFPKDQANAQLAKEKSSAEVAQRVLSEYETARIDSESQTSSTARKGTDQMIYLMLSIHKLAMEGHPKAVSIARDFYFKFMNGPDYPEYKRKYLEIINKGIEIEDPECIKQMVIYKMLPDGRRDLGIKEDLRGGILLLQQLNQLAVQAKEEKNVDKIKQFTSLISEIIDTAQKYNKENATKFIAVVDDIFLQYAERLDKASLNHNSNMVLGQLQTVLLSIEDQKNFRKIDKLPQAFIDLKKILDDKLTAPEKIDKLIAHANQRLDSTLSKRSDESELLYKALISYNPDDPLPTMQLLTDLQCIINTKSYLELPKDNIATNEMKEGLKTLLAYMKQKSMKIPDTFKKLDGELSKPTNHQDIINSLRRLGAEHYSSCRSDESKALCRVLINLATHQGPKLLSDLQAKIGMSPSTPNALLPAKERRGSDAPPVRLPGEERGLDQAHGKPRKRGELSLSERAQQRAAQSSTAVPPPIPGKTSGQGSHGG